MTPLIVWRGDQRVGKLEMERAGLRFTYDPAVIEENNPASSISIRCPIRKAPYASPEAEAVFENLLPEGDLRRALALGTKHDATDTVGLLGVVGGDCAGALQLWPEDRNPPDTPQYDELTEPMLDRAFSTAGGQLRQAAGRASLSGTQPKLSLYRMPPVDGDSPTYKLPRNGAPTTVVAKRPDATFPGLLEAELVGMRLMAASDVPTASSVRCGVARDCHESARFDREVLESSDGPHIVRLHAEDGCQITGRVSRAKYANTGGPSYADLTAVLTRWSVKALDDREHLFRWAVANIAMGNYDAHAKNISIVHVAPSQIRLAPAYDVVVTSIYPELDRRLALKFGGTEYPRAITDRVLRSAARAFRFTPARTKELAAIVVSSIRAALPDVLHAVATMGGAAEQLDALESAVRETTDDLAGRLGM